VLLAGFSSACASTPFPDHAKPGPAADELAHRIERAIDKRAWDRTGAISWVFGGFNRHLWDRRRNFARVELIGGTTVWIDLSTHRGLASRGGEPICGDDLADALDSGYRAWINDSFWLNPLVKLFDDGVERKRAELLSGRPGASGLIVQYTKGGVTPGDTYLWIVSSSGRPRAWRMWVSVLPVGGVEATWEDWTRVETGAWISRKHRVGPATLRISEVTAARDVKALAGGEDPFRALAARASPCDGRAP
jgi:hypothetical protein